MSRFDAEWQAACHLLHAPFIADRTARRIDPSRRHIEWETLLGRPWSTTERLVIEAAFAMWRGGGVELDFGQLVTLLDDENYQRVIESMALRRGDRADLAVYPGGYRNGGGA